VLWDCELVVKVKELQEPEYRLSRNGQIIFSFQHFGPEPALLDAALASGATFIAFETVGQSDGSLPILAPMSAIAGKLAVQAGAWCLQKQNGGSGVLLSGAEGVPPSKVVILGAGNVGSNALAAAHGMGAAVTVFAKTEKRFVAIRSAFPGANLQIQGLKEQISSADLVIGGVLTPGRMSPKLITRAMLRTMRPGSALVDVGIDQGIANFARQPQRPGFEEGATTACRTCSLPQRAPQSCAEKAVCLCFRSANFVSGT
jgi:alanine dehydrogenase